MNVWPRLTVTAFRGPWMPLLLYPRRGVRPVLRGAAVRVRTLHHRTRSAG